MAEFVPDKVFFQKESLKYDMGRSLFDSFKDSAVQVYVIEGARPRIDFGGASPNEQYVSSKRTLVVAIRRKLVFQTCKPSANYQLPLVTSCPGFCDYCYLQTTLGPRPYVTIYVNIDDILSRAERHMKERKPEITLFEAGAVGDPLPVEMYTGALAQAIRFFAAQESARLRVATKFDNIESLLDLDHRGHTRFRFSVNADSILQRFEKGTPRIASRLSAARRMAEKGYPVGFLIAPLFIFPGWEEEYEGLARAIKEEMESMRSDFADKLTLEFISHRFTPKAKSIILNRNPKTTLPMDEKERATKKGQFGYMKYVYPSEILKKMKNEITSIFARYLPAATVEYFV